MSLFWPARNTPDFSYISAPPPQAFIDLACRNVVILGSTGSIGRNALDIIEKSPRLQTLALAGARNIELLAKQAAQYQPNYLAVLTQSLAMELKRKLPFGYDPEIYWGPEGYAKLAALGNADCVLSAQAGSSGLTGTLAAAFAGKVIALANKESLVMAGDMLRYICSKTGSSILPVDSEHYAIFQCLAGASGKEIGQLVLTASGGPFLGKTRADLAGIKAEQAKAHPKWKMGAKISIDSATMMNKGLEYIEAMRLFGVSAEKIKILIHPEAIVHSLVRFTDDSLLAQMACPDMRLPLGACLNWPDRACTYIPPLDLTAAPPLTFLKPDAATFGCLRHALSAAACPVPYEWRKTGLNPACMILNKTNEMAVGRFLSGRCHFCDIEMAVGDALARIMNDWPAPPHIFTEGDPVADALNVSRSIDEWLEKNINIY